MLVWRSGEQSATGLKHQDNDWSSREPLNISVLCAELLEVELTLFSFTRAKRVKTIHFHTGIKAALSCLLKMGGTRNKHMMKLSKEISNYLLNHEITITAKYLPSVLNTVADRDSRKKPDSSEWLLHPNFFKRFRDYYFLRQKIYLLPTYAINDLNTYLVSRSI